MKGIWKYEWKNSCYYNRWKVLVAFGILLYLANNVIRHCLLVNENGVTLGECWLYLFEGMAEYHYTPTSRFELPVYWFLFHVYLLFMTHSYPVTDLYEMGWQILLMTKSRSRWILTKVIWTTGMVVLYYLAQLLIMSCVMKVLDSYCGQELLLSYKVVSYGKSWWIPYVLPLISDIAIALGQMVLSFLWSPLMAYIFSVTYLIIAVYVQNPLLLGNFSMMLRNENMVENGLKTSVGFSISVLLTIGSVVISIYHLNKRDIMRKAEG